MTLAEFPDAAVPAHRHAAGLEAWVRARLGDLAAEFAVTTHVNDPAALADHLALLMEGAYASVQALGADGPAKRARALAETLLAAPGGRPASHSR